MYKIPKVVIPDSAKKYRPPKVKLTLEEIKQISDDELMMLLSGEGRSELSQHHFYKLYVFHELTSRQIKKSSKPHWTAFYVGVLLALIAAVTGVVAILK